MAARSTCSDSGIALVVVLLLSALVGSVALGLALILSVNHLVVRNLRESAALGYAARAGVEMAAYALDGADWTDVLSGSVQAAASDGPPSGTRRLDGGESLDLGAETNLLNCGVPDACTTSQLQTVTADRPWGANNPTWRLFLYGPLSSFAVFDRAPLAYLLVWVADDGRERDDDPERDGNGPGEPGANVLLVRAVAIARGSARRGFEAEAVRICRAGPAAPGCQPGIGVQSWRDLRWSVP